MQRRDNIPDIVYPGMISLFGGHREENESFLECVAREISEELTYVIPPEGFTHLVSLREGMEDNLARGEIYFAENISVEQIKVTEGSLLLVESKKADHLLSEMTPSARLGIQTFWLRS